jgi:glyoxylase-like metal-dependent hydrolase (beta-lactamase superfamily II)
MHDTLIQSPPKTNPQLENVTDDIARLRTWIVNLFFVGEPGSSDWILVDTGMPFWADEIQRLARERFGDAPPRAIVLTHGHFDHVGTVKELSQRWDVEVFAHHLELPYLTGQSDYPPPDPSVGGGLMARTSFVFPRSGIDLRPRVRALPTDGSIPVMPGWQAIETPGHTPGHISLWRESDRSLIAGDAFITTRQESLYSVLTQEEVMHGPPWYFTQDWNAARESVRRLAELDPEIAVTGHGPAMRGERLQMALNWLDDHFDETGMPRDGRYVREPARADERGTYYIPPPVPDATTKLLIAAAAIGAGALLMKLFAPSRKDD